MTATMKATTMARPARDEAAPYYFTYIDRVKGDDIVSTLEAQLDETLPVLTGISEEKSRHRYAPDKWSIRQLLGHVNDAERLFGSRAFWFARGFTSPLPSFEQDEAVEAARSDDIAWTRHVHEFRVLRPATIAFFRHLPADAWPRMGSASGNPFTVRALAYITAGHLAHHMAILQERYL